MLFRFLFFVLGLAHWLYTIYLTQGYSDTFSIEQKIVFFSVKVLSFLLIMSFWNLFPFLINKIKNNDELLFSYIRNFLLYFFFNLILIFITKPFSIIAHDFLYIFSQVPDYNIAWFQHVIPSYFSILAYNIIPCKYGIAICSIFVYSIIFSYIVNQVKINYSKKYYYILYLFFFFPPILIFNLVQERLITSAYLFIFVILISLFNQNKKSSNIFFSIAYGILSSLLVSLRTEFIAFVILFPIMVFFMRNFTRRHFFVYCSVFLVLFVSIFYIQKRQFGISYELHNMSFVYDTCVQDNLDCNKIEKILPLVLKTEYTGCLAENLDTSNNKINKKFLSVLIQTLVENYKFIITKNIRNYYNSVNNVDFIWLNMRKNPIFDETMLYTFINVKLPSSYFVDDIISKFVYFSDNYFCNKFLKLFYNFYLTYFLLVFIFLYGLLCKRFFFIYLFVIYNYLLFVVFLTMPIYRYFYLYVFNFTVWILFFIVLIMIFSKNKKVS